MASQQSAATGTRRCPKPHGPKRASEHPVGGLTEYSAIFSGLTPITMAMR